MKIKTEFGIMEIKPLKTFVFNGVTFCLVNAPERYLNAVDPIIMRRIVEYKTSSALPLSFSHRETQKNIVAQAINFLQSKENEGYNIFEMVQNTKDEIINR